MGRNIARVAVIAAWVMCCLALAPDAAAQQERQVTATGSSTITAQPEILRVTVQLQGEGADVKEALAKLSAEKQGAKEKLATLGVAAEGVTFTEPMLGDAPMSAQQRQMQMFMSMRGGEKKPATTKSSVTVSSVLTAEVPLKASGPDELLIAATEAQDKLTEQFKPKGADAAASPEEQEVLDEMMEMDMGDGGGAKPGEPSFLYVHKIAQEEQEKALADAFANARKSAEQLAKAVGLSLGDVRTVSASSKSGGAEDDEDAYFAMMASMSGQDTGGAIVQEATSTQPGPVTCKVTVTSAFTLK